MNYVEKSGASAPLIPLLLGKGKLARHLHHYFHLSHFPHKHFEDARDLTNPELMRKIREVNAIWILTSDQSIESVYRSLQEEMQKADCNPDHYTFIHSSAASEIKGMHTIHPLMTFGPELYTLEQYQKIPFAMISSDSDELSESFTVPNPRFQVFSAQRALYHAYAVMMSNLPILLWSLSSKEAKNRLGLPPEIFDPILKQTLDNFLQHRSSALTGPIVRNDTTTVQKNLKALGSSPLVEIYQSFLTAFNQGEHHDHRT
jgi:hypothetical protein